MKKFLCVLLTVFSVIMLFSGCKAEKNEDKLSIVTTAFPTYDFAKKIAGDKAHVTMLIRPGSESHSFEPTPADIKKVTKSDMFVVIGGESENWAEKLIESCQKEEEALRLIDSVELLSLEEHGEEHDHSTDEHIWTSPVNARKMSKAILQKLCDIDAENREYYEKNYRELENELLSLDKDFKEALSSENITLVFGDRFPFLYLVKEYGINYKAAFPGCTEQTEPDINTMTELINFIKENNISTVFYTEFSTGKTADMLCGETGAKKSLLHSCHNVTKEEWENGETYVSLMRKNLENIKNSPE